MIWYTKNYDNLSDESVVEVVLNYGNWHHFEKLIKVLGIKKTAKIFKKESNKKRSNFYPEVKNYFTLYFNKYAK
ncbi:hypothetical protein KKC65_02645 [Patescibacteria group bacterium]|nr:hypothetical protein [Patescibacteria group bacterium]